MYGEKKQAVKTRVDIGLPIKKKGMKLRNNLFILVASNYLVRTVKR